MKKSEQKTSKKGVSLMLSYVLLIIIVLSVAVGVYAWLRFYGEGFFKPTPKCPEDVSIIIQDYSCDPTRTSINITIKNKGLFSIDGYKIRGTDDKTQVPIFALKEMGKIGVIGGEVLFEPPLKPDEVDNRVFSYMGLSTLEKIEIEPFRSQEQKIVLCSEAVVSQEINCII